jgi:rSAM/selenodomain-associated transferase 1
MNHKALLVMAKRPSPARTKTRLSSVLGLAGAAELYACFLRDALALARLVPGVTPFVAHFPTDAETAAYFRDLAPDFGRIPQIGHTLGERLDAVMSTCSLNGYEQVVAMNSDSPTLPADYLAQAFARLGDEATDVVLGPCDDGGYYLIGWKRPHPRLVREVPMSTDHVLRDTVTIAEEEKLRVSLLPTWYDVDEAANLERVRVDLLAIPEIARHTRDFLSQKQWLIPHPANKA